MTAKSNAAFTLADLDDAAASERPFEFELLLPDAAQTPSGVWLKVLGDESETVKSGIAVLMDGRRKAEAKMAMRASRSGRNAEPEIMPWGSEIEFNDRLVAVRLVSWRKPGETDGLTEEQKERFRGLSDEPTPENRYRLVHRSNSIRDQVSVAAAGITNFTQRSSKIS